MRGKSIGRYVVLSRLGEGGMGVVYAAYDGELNRKVALKVLREDVGEAAELSSRLLREAQAMARLSHPNVVAVHDVGRFENSVFLAMEFVDGRTVREWLEEQPRSWREVLEVFREAGKGLSAAHSAGLIHRDFKPANVMVGKDHSVKVTDFGLAVAPDLGSQSGRMSVAGTPDYMAPEQLRGEMLDARADQYSYCVALYESLTHQAFVGESTVRNPTSSDGVRAGKTRSFTGERGIQETHSSEMTLAAKGARVPRWLLRPLLRGLSANRADRFESLDELLQCLEEPAKPWKRVGAGLALAAMVVTSIVAYRITQRRQSSLCRGSEENLTGVWDSTKQAAIQRTFSSSDRPYAADAFFGIKQALDRRAHSWVAMHTEACQATRLRGEQSEAMLDLRMGCLQNRLEEMRALTDLFAQADAQTIEKSIDAANALTPLRACADADALKAQVRPPQDPSTRAQVERHRKALAEIKELKDTGKYAQGLERAKRLVTDARDAHDRPLEAEAELMLGGLLQWTRQLKEAEDALRAAGMGADSVRDDGRRAQAWMLLAYVVGYQGTRIDEGLRLAREAEAVLERLGKPPELDSELQYVFGAISFRQGKHAEALRRFKQALDLGQKALGPQHPLVRTTIHTLGNVLAESGNYEEALHYMQKAVELSQSSLGPRHPHVADSLTSLGNLLRRQRRFEEAQPILQRALAIKEKANGSEDTDLISIGGIQ